MKFYCAELINGIEHLHKNGIVHRDLKPQNILISDTLHCKLIDFGDSLVEGTKEKIHDHTEEEEKGEQYVEFKPTDDSDEDEGYSPGKEY